ncbi:MAG: hypothetical protein IAE86_06885 [Burkholderiaceae bacterium]|nr:hypothetical protein [Burkholderiaceae bacterium]
MLITTPHHGGYPAPDPQPSPLQVRHGQSLELLNYALMGGRIAGDGSADVGMRAMLSARTGVPCDVLDRAIALHDMLVARIRAGGSLWSAAQALCDSGRAMELFDEVDAAVQAAIARSAA